MKCGRVYEIAGRLHKRMDDVLEDLKSVGADVTGYSSLADDEAIRQVAELYGKTIKLPFIPDIPEVEGDGQKLVVLPPDLVEVAGRILDTADDSLKIKAERPVKNVMRSAVRLISKESKSIYTVKEDIQLLLIPQSVKNEKRCRFRLDKYIMINGLINPEECMVLLTVGGRVWYEPASFVVLDGIWYFDALQLLRDKGAEPNGKLNPRYAGKFSAYKKAVLAADSGYVTQAKSGKDYEVTVHVDPVKLCIGDGAVGEFVWVTDQEKYTVRTNSLLRGRLMEFLGRSGDIGIGDFEELLRNLMNDMKNSGAKASESGGESQLPDFSISAAAVIPEDETAADDAGQYGSVGQYDEGVQSDEIEQYEDMGHYEEAEQTDGDGQYDESLRNEAPENTVLPDDVEWHGDETVDAGAEPVMESDSVDADEASVQQPEASDLTDEAEDVSDEDYEEPEETINDIFIQASLAQYDFEPWFEEGSSAEEAYKRLMLMVQGGLLADAGKVFAEIGGMYYSEGPEGQMFRLEDNDYLMNVVRNFEEQYAAIAFYGIISDSPSGRLLSIFYVTDELEQWEMERMWLKNKNPIVYVENMDDASLSSFGSIHFEFVGEGTVREQDK